MRRPTGPSAESVPSDPRFTRTSASLSTCAASQPWVRRYAPPRLGVIWVWSRVDYWCAAAGFAAALLTPNGGLSTDDDARRRAPEFARTAKPRARDHDLLLDHQGAGHHRR